MGALAASVGCLGYWAVSLFSDRADSAMSFGSLGLDVSLSNGAVKIRYAASISLLVPSLAFGLAAAVFIWLWRRTVRELSPTPTPGARQETHYLDEPMD